MLTLKLCAQGLYERPINVMFRLRYLRCLMYMQICLNRNLNSETCLVQAFQVRERWLTEEDNGDWAGRDARMQFEKSAVA